MSSRRTRGRPRAVKATRDASDDIGDSKDDIDQLVSQAVAGSNFGVDTELMFGIDDRLNGTSTAGSGGDDDYVGQDSDSGSDLNVVLEDADNEEVYLPKKRKMKNQDGPKNKVANSSKGSTPNFEKKGRLIRSLKDLSAAKDKIIRLFGVDEKKLLGLAKVKEGFETCVFDFPLENVQKHSKYCTEVINPTANVTNKETELDPIKSLKESTKYRKIQADEFVKNYKHREGSIAIRIDSTEVDVAKNEKMEFPVLPNGKRIGFVHNIGALITDMAWLPQTEDNVNQYLAISVSQHWDSPLDPKLQMFQKESHYSAIEVHKLNIETMEFTMVQTIAHDFGESWDLKWHELFPINDKNLGVLSFVSQNGSVNFIEVSSEEEVINFCEQPMLRVTQQDNQITTYDYLNPSTIICGFKTGHVAEFNLQFPNLPLYYQKLHDSHILTISVAYSDFENLVVGTVSVDGNFYIFDPKNIPTTKLNLTRFRGTNILPIVYIPQLYTFVFSDGINCMKAVTPKALFIHPVVTRDSTITCIGTSRVHPMALSASSDGSIVIDNVARRMLTGVKNNKGTHKSLVLWKWHHLNEENTFLLDHSYEVINLAVNDVCKIHIDPFEINITSVKWNENRCAAKFYAFANAAGLLTIEKLGGNE